MAYDQGPPPPGAYTWPQQPHYDQYSYAYAHHGAASYYQPPPPGTEGAAPAAAFSSSSSSSAAGALHNVVVGGPGFNPSSVPAMPQPTGFPASIGGSGPGVGHPAYYDPQHLPPPQHPAAAGGVGMPGGGSRNDWSSHGGGRGQGSSIHHPLIWNGGVSSPRGRGRGRGRGRKSSDRWLDIHVPVGSSGSEAQPGNASAPSHGAQVTATNFARAEVFQCEVDDCGHFYHPKCAAELLYPDGEQAPLFEVHVAAGEKFTCPRHECIVCKGGEDKNDWDMQFAVCRRCPTTYHRKCLPSNIPFETKKGPNGYMQRAWDKWEGPDGRTIPRDRILIYCMKHDIKTKLKTPKLNHIIFPDAKKVRVPKILVGSTTEEDIPEEADLLDKTSPEPSESPLPVQTDENQCSCSSPFDSFAPESLFRHPHPGTCGWLGD